MKVFPNLESFSQFPASEEIVSTGWFTVTQEMVNSFADATKDFQWIHVDPERAKKESPFGTPIAHGFFSLSLLPKFIEDMISIETVKMGVNYGVNKVRFPHHVPVGAQLKARILISSVEPYEPAGVKVTWDCIIDIKDAKRPACVAQMISLMFE